MSGVFPRKRFGNHPQAELPVLQSSFAVGDHCFEEIRCGLVEQTKVCTPSYVADGVDSGLPHLGHHRGYLRYFILENLLLRVRSATDKTAKLRRISGSNVGDAAFHCAMAYLTWIAQIVTFGCWRVCS